MTDKPSSMILLMDDKFKQNLIEGVKKTPLEPIRKPFAAVGFGFRIGTSIHKNKPERRTL
ncbi:MAG TPA: hypothetical protein DDZ51_27975 [Planctomycetaceae bacterium]|nr:hypothetical protein [Planctomycetaceae bacterium]